MNQKEVWKGNCFIKNWKVKVLTFKKSVYEIEYSIFSFDCKFKVHLLVQNIKKQ